MALTTYPGVTSPSIGWAVISNAIIAGFSGISNSVSNNAQTMPNSGASCGDGIGINYVGSNLNVIYKGDVVVIVTVSDVGVSSVGVGSSGLTFTQVASMGLAGIWVSGIAAATVIGIGSASATTTSGTTRMHAYVVHNVSSVSSITANSATSTTPSLTMPALTAPNALSMFFLRSGAAPTAQRTTPPVAYTTSSTITGTIIQSMVTTPVGIGTVETYSSTLASSSAWNTVGITFYGPTVQLDDMTFKLTDNGILLNDPSDVTPPIYDINTVTGLVDLDAAESDSAIDGANGSYVDAKFTLGKTVVIDGTLIDTPPINESRYDTLKTSASPVDVAIPFYFKLPGQNPRVLMVKPIGFKSDLDRVRSIGSTPFQIQMKNEDSVAYAVATTFGVANTLGIANYIATPLVNNGNAETYPLIYFNVYNTSDIGTPGQFFKFYNPEFFAIVAGKSVNGATIGIEIINQLGGVNLANSAVGEGYVLDLKRRTLTRLSDGSDWSMYITGRTWWSLLSGSNQIVMQRPGGSSTSITNEGFSYAYDDAWR